MLKGFRALFIGRTGEFPRELSSHVQAEGRRLFQRFFLLNGISVAFLLENLLILYALRNGVAPALTAVLSTFIHLTMPSMILGKIGIARIGAARTWGWCWFLRYVSALLLIAAPFLKSQYSVTVLILAGAFGFALFRSMGVVATTPLEGEVTTHANRGSFLSGNQLRVNLAHLVSLTILILILRFIDAIWIYQLVIALGCLVGMYASTLLAQIPETGALGTSARIPIRSAFLSLWKKKKSRNLLFAWSAGMVAFTVVIPFMMIAVKSGYGIPDHEALFFSLILLLGAIISTYINGMISDHVGPRPLLVIHTSVLILPAVYWSFAPEAFFMVPVGLAFFIAGYCKFGIIVGLGQYFLSAVDTADRVGSVLFIRIFSGIAAGLTGSVIGGGLLTLFEHIGYSGIDIYRSYFRLMLLVIAVMVVVVTRLQKLEEWRVKDIFALLVSPKDIYALHVLKGLRNQTDFRKNTQQLKRLGAIGSAVSEEELRRQLGSPLLSVRYNAMQGLRRISIAPETEQALIRELQRGEFTSAWSAAEILGEKRVQAAADELRRGLESPDPFLRGKCMVSLVKLKDTTSYPRIIKLFKDAENPRIVIHGANALVLMKKKRLIRDILEKSLNTHLPSSAIDEILTSAAELVGAGSQFYQFLQQYNTDEQAGTSQFFTDLEGQVFRTKQAGLLLEIGREGQSTPSLYRALSCYTADKRDEVSRSVRKVLAAADEQTLPLKTAFCMALLISSSAGKQLPPPAVVD